MKNCLLRLLHNIVRIYIEVLKNTFDLFLNHTRLTKILISYQFKRSTRKIQNRERRLGDRSIIIAIFFTILSINSKSQVTDTTIFPLNDYLTSNNSYPFVNNAKINAIDTSRFINVMNYGAKGDGITLDDNAIVSAFKAAQSANTGVLFPSGKTFMVSKTSSISLNKNMTVWAYGATIKMAAFKRYSAFAFPYPAGSRKNNFIWLGGTIDGNKDHQSWPGSPTGQTTWEEDHGQMVRVLNAGFVLFKDVTVINPVVDGITFSKCRIAVVSDCKAADGAPLRYSEVRDQGTYFKVRQSGGTSEGTAFYIINTTCSYGSIGIHYSTNYVEDSSVTVLNNVEISNGAQDAIHFEHCKKNFMYNCSIWRDTTTKIYNGARVRKYSADIHVSNNTLIASIKNCKFQDARVDARNSSDLKIGVIDSSEFINTTSGVCVDGTKGFTHIINSTIKGQAGSFQTKVRNALKNTFQDFGSHNAISGGMIIDSNTFINGSAQPISLLKGGLIYQCTFSGCDNPNKNITPLNDNWKKNFEGYIDILNDQKKYLGRISLGMTSTSALNSGIISKATITDNKSTSINLFPNPVTNILHVTLNEKIYGKTFLYIYDQQGRLVRSTIVYKNTPVSVEIINVETLSTGLYILQIVNSAGKVSSKFIIKNK